MKKVEEVENLQIFYKVQLNVVELFYGHFYNPLALLISYKSLNFAKLWCSIEKSAKGVTKNTAVFLSVTHIQNIIFKF